MSIISLLIFLFFTVRYTAQNNPFTLELKTAKASYTEGESIEFILSLKNNDSLKTFPILIPGLRHGTKKMFQFELCENKIYGKVLYPMILLREERNSNITNCKQKGSEILYLKPKQKIDLKLYLNHQLNPRADSGLNASYHHLPIPLFAGEYLVRVNYIPKGTSANDTIFSYINPYEFTHDLQVYSPFKNGKLALSEYGVASNTCKVIIKPCLDEKFKIYGCDYRSLKTKLYTHYYKTKTATKNHVGYTKLNSDGSRIFRFANDTLGYYFNYSVNRQLMEFRTYKTDCYVITSGFKYDENNGIIYYASTNEQGVSTTVYKYPDGRINFQHIVWSTVIGKEQSSIITYVYTKNRREPLKEIRVDLKPCNK